MARYQFSREDCIKGGKARAAMPDFVDCCRKGFEACMEQHPLWYNHLKRKIKGHYKLKQRKQAASSLIKRTGTRGKRKPMKS